MLALPDRSTDEGLEARVLLAECRSPAYSSYTADAAKTCMQFMDLVLWNRVNNPKPYGANSATLLAVVKAPGQFAGFGTYPNYDAGIKQMIQDMLDIANNAKDKRHETYATHIQTAIDITKATIIPDPTPPDKWLVAWRTSGSASPGTGFVLFRTVAGVSFYYK